MSVVQKGLEEEEIIDGEGLAEFVEEADMPYFVEGLGDEELCIIKTSGFLCPKNSVDKASLNRL
jgi:hypothetical protein